ncbi:MAG TPA: ABC transporter ATP-binding protein [Candidatus Binatia bacterium]|nr:ABC transporter ATP-binding protein [Candidatus Binatia bacterium]
MSLLEVHDLSVSHGPIEVLHDLSLAVGEGEIVAVIGPNGSGKTTLLRTLAGVLRPRRGTITLAGRALGGEPAWRVVRHGMALVPEGRRIFADQTVRANLELGAASHGRLDGLPEVLARFPALRERLDHAAGALSGGQQQMLAIARGLMARPRLLLLDEPSLGLAPRLVRDTFEAVRRIRAEGVSVLLVEQLAALALEVADRGYVLDRGRIVAAGPARELRADPRVVGAYLGRVAPSP